MLREAMVNIEGNKAISKIPTETGIQDPQQARLKNIFNENVSLVDFDKINMEYSLLNNEKMVGIKMKTGLLQLVLRKNGKEKQKVM